MIIEVFYVVLLKLGWCYWILCSPTERRCSTRLSCHRVGTHESYRWYSLCCTWTVDFENILNTHYVGKYHCISRHQVGTHVSKCDIVCVTHWLLILSKFEGINIWGEITYQIAGGPDTRTVTLLYGQLMVYQESWKLACTIIILMNDYLSVWLCTDQYCIIRCVLEHGEFSRRLDIGHSTFNIFIIYKVKVVSRSNLNARSIHVILMCTRGQRTFWGQILKYLQLAFNFGIATIRGKRNTL